MAQSDAQFVAAFSGPWQIYDRQLASGSDLCKLALAPTAVGQHFTLSVNACNAPISAAATWNIDGSQLVIYDARDQVIARLGGSQKRVTGLTGTGVPIVLERAGGDGTAAALRGAVNASGCYFLGYTQTCAKQSDLSAPQISVGGGKIKMLVDLSVRSEPRADADIVGAVKSKQCVTVEACTVASDGPWCKAVFGSTAGWLRKFTLRQNRWPVMVFDNSCS